MSRRRVSPSQLGEHAQEQIANAFLAEKIRDELAAEKRRNATPEEDMQIAIAEALTAILPDDVWWTHIPNGMKRGKRAAGRLKAMGTRAGAPDLIFAHRGVMHAIELKVGKRPASEDQEKCHAALDLAGVPVTIARSLDDVLRALDGWGIPNRIARKA